MMYYRNMTFWENRKRANELTKYANGVVKYYNLVDYDPYSGDYVGGQATTPIRAELNRQNAVIQGCFYSAGISPYYIHTDAPVAGGRKSRINFVDNLFNLQNYGIYPQNVLDQCNVALGVYDNDYTNALFRTFNPFFWLGRILEKVAEIPFYFIGKLGFDQEKAEDSFFGKVVKFVIKLFGAIQFLIAFIDLLNLSGFNIQTFSDLRKLYVFKFLYNLF